MDDGYLFLKDGEVFCGSDWIPEHKAIVTLASKRGLCVRYPIRMVDDLLPVSYTHLDVYKRQAQVQRFSCSDTSVYGQPGLATGGSVAVFYFQQLLNTALAGIDGTAIISTITNIAFAILLIGFLIGLYQAAFRGGDLQALAGTAIKYLVVAMIVSNWATVFRGVNGSFNTIANRCV